MQFIWKIQLTIYGSNIWWNVVRCILVVTGEFTLLTYMLGFFNFPVSYSQMFIYSAMIISITNAQLCPYFVCSILKNISHVKYDDNLLAPKRPYLLMSVIFCAILFLTSNFVIYGPKERSKSLFIIYMIISVLQELGTLSFICTVGCLASRSEMMIKDNLKNIDERLKSLHFDYIQIKNTLSLPFFVFFTSNAIVSTFYLCLLVLLTQNDIQIIATASTCLYFGIVVIYLALVADDIYESFVANKNQGW